MSELKRIYNLFEGQMFVPCEGFSRRAVYVREMSPRHPYFDGLLEIGKGFVTAVCDKTPFPEGTFSDVWLVYPERWMNLKETRFFLRNLQDHPEVQKIEYLSVVTSSIELITTFENEQIRDIDSMEVPNEA